MRVRSDDASARAVTRQIVVLGGGGFSNDPFDAAGRLLDGFVLGLARRRRPKVCFVPTASGDADSYGLKFYRAFADRAQPSDLSLFQRARRDDLREFVLDQDVIYVGGGSTLNMLAVWREHGLDEILREAWRGGVVLAGISAGMICWFEHAATDLFGNRKLVMIDGLGLLSGAACSHFSNESYRRPEFQRLIGESGLAGTAADDGVAMHYVGRQLREVVAVTPAARAYRLEVVEGSVVETAIEPRQLPVG